MWERHRALSAADRAQAPKLFGRPPEEDEGPLPELEEDPVEEGYDQIAILGFPLCSPFDLLKVRSRGDVRAQDLTEREGETVRIVGYFVTVKPVTTVNGKRMGFGTWLDDRGDFFDTTHFPRVYAQYPFRGVGCYLIRGKVDLDFGFPTITVDRMEKLAMKDAFI